MVQWIKDAEGAYHTYEDAREGMEIGSVAGPWGEAAGGVIGAGIGIYENF